jgi:hypothetical protein
LEPYEGNVVPVLNWLSTTPWRRIGSALVGGEWSTSHPGCFTRQGKSPRYPLDRRLGGPQSQSGRFGEEKILGLPGLELRPLSRPAHS